MDMALEAARKHPERLHTLGPLIHNPQAVEYLENLGVSAMERIEDVPGGTVIFRSHGVSLRDLNKAKRISLLGNSSPIRQACVPSMNL
jgi:4-hydroxy-3-methylbut-2-enyl diphosphate reductase